MKVIIYPLSKSLVGSVKAPPSKSYTHRALFNALLSDGESEVVNPLVAGDTEATLGAIESFGANTVLIEGGTPELRIVGRGSNLLTPSKIYCRGSGTTLRIATAVAALCDGPVLLYGNESLNKRPIAPLLKALNSLGVTTSSRDGKPPVIVKGPVKVEDTEVVIDASVSSQFVTALLTIAPLIGLRIKVVGKLKSLPYIDITLDVLNSFGIKYERLGYREFIIPKSKYLPSVIEVPGDYSSAAFIMAAAALGGDVVISNLRPNDPQGDRVIIDLLRELGVDVVVNNDSVRVVSDGGPLRSLTINCSNTPDLVPVIAALAPYAGGTTKVVGAEHLVFKESNRLVTLTRNLRSLGVDAVATEDGILVRGGKVRGGVVNSFGDHRVAMAMAITALRAEEPVVIKGFECVKDSYPNFISDLRSLGAYVEVISD